MVVLADQLLEAADGGLYPFAFPVGVAVINQTFAPPRLDMPNQPLVDHAVDEGGRENFTQLWVGDREYRKGLRAITALRDSARLRKNEAGQRNEVSTFMCAVACLSRTLK